MRASRVLYDLPTHVTLGAKAAAGRAAGRRRACQLLLEFHSRLSPLGYQAKADTLLVLQSLGFTLLHNVVRPSGADDAFLMNPRFC